MYSHHNKKALLKATRHIIEAFTTVCSPMVAPIATQESAIEIIDAETQLPEFWNCVALGTNPEGIQSWVDNVFLRTRP